MKTVQIFLLSPLFLALIFYGKSTDALEEDCVDYFGNIISHGNLFVPGPSVCSLCVCYHSKALWCRSIFCEPPYYCKKFRIGEKCCEFECLDTPEEIQKEKERLRKRRRFLGIVFEANNEGAISKSHIHIIASLSILIMKAI